MSFKGKIAFSFSLFVLLVAGLGAGLVINSFREEKAFRAGRNSLRVQYMSQEVDYFLNRKFRAVQAYVLLGDEAEKLQIRETESVIQKKLDTWTQWVKKGEAPADDLASMKEVNKSVSEIAGKVL